MKKNAILLLTLLSTSSIFGTAFELPDINLEEFDPEIEITIPEPNIQSFSLIPDSKIEDSELDKIWEGIEREIFVSNDEKNPSNFEVHKPAPFSAIVVIPNDNSDERMVHQPAKIFEYNMPILKPEFQLDSSQKEDIK